MGKAILRGMGRIFDISGNISSRRIEKIYNKNIINGFLSDKKNIRTDFNISIKRINNGES